jgi:hypothetical protein
MPTSPNVRICGEECVNSRASRSIFGAECACRRAAEDLAVMGARRRVIFCRSFYRPGRAEMSAMAEIKQNRIAAFSDLM